MVRSKEMFYTYKHTKDQTAKSKPFLGIKGTYESRKRKNINQEIRNEDQRVVREWDVFRNLTWLELRVFVLGDT